jgi:hypothetical protein
MNNEIALRQLCNWQCTEQRVFPVYKVQVLKIRFSSIYKLNLRSKWNPPFSRDFWNATNSRYEYYTIIQAQTVCCTWTITVHSHFCRQYTFCVCINVLSHRTRTYSSADKNKKIVYIRGCYLSAFWTCNFVVHNNWTRLAKRIDVLISALTPSTLIFVDCIRR